MSVGDLYKPEAGTLAAHRNPESGSLHPLVAKGDIFLDFGAKKIQSENVISTTGKAAAFFVVEKTKGCSFIVLEREEQ
jgi:hypothetical protein